MKRHAIGFILWRVTFTSYVILLFRYCPRILLFLFLSRGGSAKIVLIRTRGEGGQKPDFYLYVLFGCSLRQLWLLRSHTTYELTFRQVVRTFLSKWRPTGQEPVLHKPMCSGTRLYDMCFFPIFLFKQTRGGSYHRLYKLDKERVSLSPSY